MALQRRLGNRVIGGLRALAVSLAGLVLASAAHPAPEHSSVHAAEKVATCGGFLEGAAFDSEGTLWVVDLMSGNVFAVTPGRCDRKANTGGAPNGARFAPDGRLFIADNKRGILAFDTRTLKISTIVDRVGSDPMASANDIAFDDEGGVYVTLPNGSDAVNLRGRVAYAARGQSSATIMSDGLSFPNGVAVTPDGDHILVGQFTDKSILMIPTLKSEAKLKAASVFGRTVGGDGPDGMAIRNGILYYANFGDRSIGRMDMQGHSLAPITLPDEAGTMVTNVAFRGDQLFVTEASKGEVWVFRLSLER